MVRVLVLILAIFLMPWPQAHAQDALGGGQGSNLVVCEGKVTISRETLEIKLHLGFAEVTQNFDIQGSDAPQKVIFGFPYRLGQSEQSLTNFSVLIDGFPVETDSTKESDGQSFLYWKIFPVEINPNQTRQIKLTHWQMNGANLRGWRTFDYGLKNKLAQPISEFNLQLSLMDGLSLNNFNKTVNPDLDLRLEPVGGEKKGTGLVWQWQNLTPAFDILAYFYWADSDLAKTADLNKNLGLYQVTATPNNEEAVKAVDSSYLTAWSGKSLTLTFPTKTIQEVRLIPGQADTLENFQNASRPKEITLDFGQSTSQTITLEDKMAMQTFSLAKPVETNQLKMTINSVYAGKTLPDDAFITEVELGSNLNPPDEQIKNDYNQKDRPFWQKFFIDLWDKVWSWLKNIFQ